MAQEPADAETAAMIEAAQEIEAAERGEVVDVEAAWLAGLDPTGTSGPARAVSMDDAPPDILVLPPEWQRSRDEFVIQVRVYDASGVGSVTAHVRHDPKGEYIEAPMRLVEDDRWELRVPASEAEAVQVAYYIEAFDSNGRGPSLSGTPTIPFVVDEPGKGSTGMLADGSGTNAPALALGLFCFGVVIVGLLLKRSGPESVAVPVATTAPARRLVQRKTPPRRRSNRDPLQIAEDIFWLCLMDPLTGMDDDAAEEALEELSEEPQIHPIDGLRMYEVRELRERFWWARLANMELLFDQWRSSPRQEADDNKIPLELLTQTDRRIAEFKTRGRARRAAGYSLIETLGVVAILGLLTTFTVVSLKPIEQPVAAMADVLQGTLRQARSKAMATTTAQRVRIFKRELVVEAASGAACKWPWVADTTMAQSVPDDIGLSPSNWIVCFDSRGVASSSVTITMTHPDYDPKQLQIMLGGSTRWL